MKQKTQRLIGDVGSTISLAKMGLDNTQHQLLFCYCAAVVGATEVCSSKNFILSFKPAYRQAGKKSTTVPGRRNAIIRTSPSPNVSRNTHDQY